MALVQSLNDRENQKFVETTAGEVAVRIAGADGITFGAKSTMLIKAKTGDATITYIGKTLNNLTPSTAAAEWQIWEIDETAGSFTWAEGDPSYTHVWDDRESLSYPTL